jgi:micrococcal nuclease
MRWLLVLAFILGLAAPAHTAMGTVRDILDGDTADVAVNGTLVRLRFSGIAAPEVHNIVPCAAAMGLAAKARVVQLLSGQTVRYESLGLDKYKRVIAMVFLGDVWISELMVREGLARRVSSYPVAKSDRSRLIAAEAEAKTAHRGLWAQ